MATHPDLPRSPSAGVGSVGVGPVGVGWVVAAAVLFGTSGIAKGLGPEAVPALFAGAWRTLLGGVALVAVALVTGRRLPWRPSVLVGGAAAVIAYQLCFFGALDRLGVATTVVVSIGTGPVVAGLIDALGPLRRRPSTGFVAGAALAVVGVVLVSWPLGEVDPIGVALAVVAGTAVPLYGAAAQVLLSDEDVDPLGAMAAIFGAAAVVAAPIAAVTTLDLAGADAPPPTLEVVALVAWLGLAATALAYWLWGRGLAGLPLGVVAVATMAEPAAATVLSWLILGDPIKATTVLGVAVVGVGVRVATRASS